jgi:hypothetical protein
MYKVLSTKYKVEVRNTAFVNHKNLVSPRKKSYQPARRGGYLGSCYFPNVECPTLSDEGRSGDSLRIQIGLLSLMPGQNQR